MSFSEGKYYETMNRNKMNIQLQSTLKLEEQAYSNEILCRMLSTAECYFYRVLNKTPEEEIFGYYNGFNSGNTKSLEHLKKQLLNEIELFKTSYEDYVYQYKKYDFPVNLTMKNILNIIEQWKHYLISYQKYKEIEYYESISELIKGNLGVCFRKEIKELNKGKVNTYGQVSKQLMKNIPYIQEKAEKFVQRIRENAKKGIFDVNVVLYGKYKDDYDLIEGQKHYNNLNNMDNSDSMNIDDYQQNYYNEKREKDKIECIDLFNNICKYFDIYCYKIYHNQDLMFVNKIDKYRNIQINEIVDNLKKNMNNFEYVYGKFITNYKGKSVHVNNLISNLKDYVDDWIIKIKGNEIFGELIKLINKYNNSP